MRIQSLKLKDFRPFHKTETIETGKQDDIGKNITHKNPIDTEIKFPDSNLTVFIGENGSGKTTILDGLSILLTKLFIGGTKADQTPIFSEKEAKILHGDNPVILEEDDIYTSKALGETPYDSGLASLNLKFEYEEKNYSWSINGVREDNGNFSEQLEIEIPPEEKKVGIDALDNLIAKIKDQISNPHFDLPVIAYYQTNRVVLDKLEFKNNVLDFRNAPQLLAYENAFSRNLFDFQNFTDWFKNGEDNESEIRLRENDLEYRDRQLEVVRTALDLFSKELDYPFSNLRIIRQVNKKRLYGGGSYSLVFDKNNNHEIKVKKLSSGEKSILVLVADIAHRLAIANPNLLEQGAEYLLQNATGIIIIDEIDLHLHPKWQRLVVPALTATFPNIQFIVTTHSALVLRKLKREQVIILKDSKVLSQNPYFEGRDTNSILEDIFGIEVRDKEFQKRISEIYQLIDNHHLDKAEKMLSILIESFGEYDNEVMRIKSYLELEKD